MSPETTAPKGTYAEHVGPFDAIENFAQVARERGASLLRAAGWKHTSQTPGSRWMWEKTMPDGRTLLVSQETALAFAREDACERVAQKWDSTGDTPDAAEEWALDIVRDYAAARGIALIETHVTGATMFDFSAWVDDHAAKIEAAIREAGRRGNASALSAWVVPSNRVEPGQPGYLHIGTEPPFFGADIVRLGPHGTALARCPYPHIRSLLWDAVRSYPIRPLPKTA